MHIAVWSGPRNLSTAMMYSFAARDDTSVWDEPFYGAYLAQSGLAHPMASEIMASQESNPDQISRRCIGDIPENKAVLYQKHMAQHMLPGFDRSWIDSMTNVFLIRDPAQVMASYHAKRQNPTLVDIGICEQHGIFQQLATRHDQIPLVVDCHDILRDPKTMLKLICEHIGLEFQLKMLSWPKGGHKNDGIWAKHWYGAVWNSTGFGPPGTSDPVIPLQSREILKTAQEYYAEMAHYKL